MRHGETGPCRVTGDQQLGEVGADGCLRWPAAVELSTNRLVVADVEISFTAYQ